MFLTFLFLSAWLRVQSPHFELYTSGGEREACQTLQTLEQVHSIFSRMQRPVVLPSPVTIIRFQQRPPFWPNEAISAFYAGDKARDFIAMGEEAAISRPVAIHEYLHLLVRHAGLQLPVWLNEGLAEFYSTMEPYDGRVLVGVVPRGRLQTLQREKWLSLGEVLQATRESPVCLRRQFYAQSWLLTHMLLVHPFYRDRFPAFALAISSDGPEAFERIYGRTGSDVEADLRRYFRSGLTEGMIIDDHFDEVVISPARQVPESEVEPVLTTLRKIASAQSGAADPVRR